MNTERKLYQWDTGQKLVGCTGLYVDFPIGNDVYRVETTNGMCIIPDELLQTSGSHKVYECMTNNTIRSFAFSVTPRPKPPEYVFTPTERLTFEGLVQKVDDAVADMIRRAESGEFDGHTPIKGTDYFTTEEIQQIQNEVSSGAIGEFKSVVDTETDNFNTNAETKFNAYNQNDSQKTNTYNTNATEKLNAYNINADNRVSEFNAQTGQIQTDISELKSDLSNETIRATNRENEIESLFTMPTQEAVNNWLNDHPEATTTVQKHSLTIDKMVVGALGYVTPEMFGAVGDGVTDDKVALQKCADNGGLVNLGDKTYYSSDTINITKNVRFSFGRIHFKSKSSVQSGFVINTENVSLEMDFVDIFSDRDNESGSLTDTVLSSNIIGIYVNYPYGENAKIRLSHCNFYDLEYGVKDNCDKTSLHIVDCNITNTLMCIFSASREIFANNCYLDCIATNKLYHCAYITTVNILRHEWHGCTFRMSGTSFNSSQGLHYYNGNKNMVGDVKVIDCDIDGIVDETGVLTIIGGKINKIFYCVKKIVNCYITGKISGSEVEREMIMYGCTIDGGSIALSNASLVMDNCVIKLSGDTYPILFSAEGNANLKIHNCSIEYNVDNHIFRINGAHDVEVVNSIIKRPGASMIIYATPGLTEEAKSKFVGNIVMSEGEFPTANNIILRN